MTCQPLLNPVPCLIPVEIFSLEISPMPTPDFSCDLCLEAEAMESLQNFQGLNLISQIQSTLTHLTFSSRDGDSSKKKKILEFLPCILHIPKIAFPLLWEPPSFHGQPHLSCFNFQERRWFGSDGDEVGDYREATEAQSNSSGQWLVQRRKKSMSPGPATRCPHRCGHPWQHPGFPWTPVMPILVAI